MATGPVSLASYWSLLKRNRNFRFLWLAQMVSELGDWFYSIAIYSLLLELTGSAEAVALAVVLQVLPQFFIAPMSGVINDRVSRKQVMIFADIARAGIVLGMLLVRTVEMVPLLYLLLLLQTFMWSFFEPGRSAVIPNLAKDDQETLVANALSSTTWSFNLMAGSALGGFVAVAFGRETVFVVNSLTFIASAFFLREMRFSEPHAETAGPLKLRDLVDFSPLLEGIRYVRSDARLLATLLVKAGLGLLGAHWVILPIFGERIFPVNLGNLDQQRAGMLGMSLLMGSRGVGALVGPLVGGYWAGQRKSRLRRGILLAFVAVTIGYTLLGFVPNIQLAALAVILAHAGGSVIWVFSTTLLHFQAEDRFRGRVFSADFGFLVLTMSIVSYLSGMAVDYGISVRTISIITGLIALLPAALWGLMAMPLWGKKESA
ncbi:MAG: MFS transporter [bacterium]|nr:MFS transporter [bacterium]